MRKFYIDDSDCASLISLITESDVFLLSGQKLIELLCNLDYPKETLHSPVYRGLVSRAIRSLSAVMEKERETVVKYCGSEPIYSYTINAAAGTLVVKDKSDAVVVKDIAAKVDKRYQRVLQRYYFIMTREADNIAFLISQHFDDNDDSFLNSDIVKRRMERFKEADEQRIRFVPGVAAIIFDNELVELSQQIVYSRNCDMVRMVV